MSVASGCGGRRWVWLVGVGGIYGCGCKEVYRFPRTTYLWNAKRDKNGIKSLLPSCCTLVSEDNWTPWIDGPRSNQPRMVGPGVCLSGRMDGPL